MTQRGIKKLIARHRALRCINRLLGSVTTINSINWEFESNQFTSEEDKKAIRRELNNILWQLSMREQKDWERMLTIPVAEGE